MYIISKNDTRKLKLPQGNSAFVVPIYRLFISHQIFLLSSTIIGKNRMNIRHVDDIITEEIKNYC